MTKIKKKNRKVLTKAKIPAKRGLRSVGGYISYKHISLLILGIGLLAMAFAIYSFTKTKQVAFDPLPTITHTTEVPDTGELLHLINNQRAVNNRTELSTDSRLEAVAQKRLQEMIDNNQYSHKSLDGKLYYELLPENDYVSAYSCENLDIESTPKPAKFIESWMSSGTGHRDCLLSDKVSKIGIASGRFGADDMTDSFLTVVILAARSASPDSSGTD